MRKLLFIISIVFGAHISAQNITTMAGNGTLGYGGDGGPATLAQLEYPNGVSFDKSGNLYISEGCHIRQINSAGTITTVAGQASCGYFGDGGPATSALLQSASAITRDTGGNMFVADWGGSFSYIRKIDAGGIISTLTPFGVSGMVTDISGNIYAGAYADVLFINPTGTYTSIAGTGSTGYSGDGGPATAAQLSNPAGVALDGLGNIYIVDRYNNRIRKINTSGIITTIAGNGTAGYGGDNGPALTAMVNRPYGIILDAAGNIYISDTDNHRIRKIDANGIITTIAGLGSGNYSGDNGPAVNAEINFPGGLAFDTLGNLYFADAHNQRIRKIDSVGVVGIKDNVKKNVSISLFPNPARNQFVIESLKEFNAVHIFNTFGEMIFKKTGLSKIKQIDVSEWAEGIYFVQVKTPEGTFTKKIIVQH